MTADIKTVMWKELKGLFRPGGSRSRAALLLIVPILIFGIVFPIQFSDDWLDTAWSLAAAFIVPIMLVATAVPESIAGERENHTLETLLASRLPDRAILFGKLLTGVLYGWGMTIALLLAGLVAVNIVEWSGRIQFYAANIILADLAASLFLSVAIAGFGVLVSLRAETVQGAQQTLMMILLLPLLLLQIGAALLPTFVPMSELEAKMQTLDLDLIVLILLGVLLLAAVGGLAWAMRRFQRTRLASG